MTTTAKLRYELMTLSVTDKCMELAYSSDFNMVELESSRERDLSAAGDIIEDSAQGFVEEVIQVGPV